MVRAGEGEFFGDAAFGDEAAVSVVEVDFDCAGDSFDGFDGGTLEEDGLGVGVGEGAEGEALADDLRRCKRIPPNGFVAWPENKVDNADLQKIESAAQHPAQKV